MARCGRDEIAGPFGVIDLMVSSSSRLFPRRTVLGGLAAGGLIAAGLRPAAAAVDFAAVFADPDVAVLGNPTGDVAVAVWSDYQCPFCKKVEPILDRVVREDGRVAVIVKEWPIFGAASVQSARTVWSARRQNRLGELRRSLMEAKARPDADRLAAAVASVGLDARRLAADIEADRAAFDAMIDRNDQQARAFGFPGTPAFVIGSFVFPGVLDENGFRQAIADVRRRP